MDPFDPNTMYYHEPQVLEEKLRQALLVPESKKITYELHEVNKKVFLGKCVYLSLNIFHSTFVLGLYYYLCIAIYLEIFLCPAIT